jgi:ketosteroid isomerase-like protein
MEELPSARDQAAILTQISRINEAWQEQSGELMTKTLGACFAEDVVMRGPDFALLGSGRDFAVQSYVDFVAQADVRNFTTDEPEVDVAGDTATALYAWQMSYVLAGQEYTEQGHDLFVFSRRGVQWLVVWRALLSS